MKKYYIFLILIIGFVITGCSSSINGKVTDNKLVNNHNQITSNDVEDLECKKDISSLNLIYPVGGETFRVGEKIKVKWTSCNIPNNEKIVARINWDKVKDGFGYGTGNFNIGVNDGEEDIIIPEQAYSSNPNAEPILFVNLKTANLIISAPEVLIFNDVTCSEGESCLPGPYRPQSKTNLTFRIVP